MRLPRAGSPKPCRVTNNEEEMIDPAVPYAYDTGMVNLGPQYQVPNPELGPLERRVEKTFVEAMFTEEVNLDDMNYWFSEPEGDFCRENGLQCPLNPTGQS